MNKNDQEFLVQKIRTQYIEKTHTQLDELKELDAKVRRPANVFAGIFGTVSALVMGSGMSMVMTDVGQILNISNPMVVGTVIGLVGMGMAALTYPRYKGVLNSRRKKYASQIMQLSDKIVGKQ